jgi:NTE family protein
VNSTKHNTPIIGLALGSGSARGLAHIGVLKVLKEAGIPINMIAGTSMGAMVGACFAKDGEISAIEELALKMHWRQLARLIDPNLNFLKMGLVTGKKIEEQLYSLIGNIEFKDLKIPLAVVAADINTGEEVVITEGSVIEAIRASISIPGIFIPVRLRSRCLVDGGLTNPVPVDILNKMGAKLTIAVNVLTDPLKRRPSCASQNSMPNIPNMLNALLQSLYIMEYEVAKSKIVKADVTINPDVSKLEAFEFHKKQEAILAGYNAAVDALPKILSLLRRC